MRVAIVHDYLTQLGGAERVVLSLLRTFPGADLYTSIYDPDTTFAEFREFDVRTTRLQSLPHHGNAGRALLPLYPRAFESLRLRGYDLVISSSSGFAHGVTVEGGFHAVYCYTPPRFLYDPDAYFMAGAPSLQRSRALLAPLLSLLRRWDRRAASRPDLYIAISDVVAERVARIYGREAPVVHPPVDVGRVQSTSQEPEVAQPYYLVLARSLAYKRLDLAIQACNELGARLVVVGDGPAHRELRSIAGPTIEFLGCRSEGDINRLLHHCTALIQPGREDFGIVPLEANAAGRPAVVFAAGGGVETVVDGVSGVHVHEQSVPAFVDALRRVERATWSPERIRAHAATFGEARFQRELLATLERHVIPTSFDFNDVVLPDKVSPDNA